MKKENKKAYLLAVGMGIGASVSMVAVKGIDNILVNYNPSSYNFFLLFDSIFPISILFFLFVLFKKIPAVWEKSRTRIICVFILMFTYIIGFYLPICLGQLDNPICFLWLPIVPFITFYFGIIFSIEYSVQTPLLSTLLFSGIFIVSATYLMIKGIKNPIKRIILFLLIGFLICMTTATPLIFMHASY